MAVNFGLLQPAQPASAFFQGQQDVRQQAEQNMLRQMQTEKLQMERENMLAQRGEREALAAERRRATEQQNALAAHVAASGEMTPEALGRFGAPGLALAKSLREEHTARIDQELKTLDYVSRNLAAATPETYGAIRADINRINPQFASALPAEFNPEQVAALAQRGMSLKDQIESKTKQTVVSPGATVLQGGKLIYTAPEKPQTYTPSPDMQGYELAKSEGFKGTFFDYKRQLAEAGRAPAQPKEPNKPVEVVGPDGKTIIVSAEEAIARRMTPAKAMEGLAPKEIQRREAVFPQAKQSVTTVTNTMSTIEQTIDRLLQNKSGLNGVTGLVGGRTPALTDAARAADADLEQLANLAFVQGITELRAASKTGAGVGNVSNKEGDRFENLKASLKRTQSYDDMVAALKRLKAQAGSTRDTVSTEFNDMYDYRQGRAAPSAPGAEGGGNFPAPPAAAIDALRRGQGTDAQFDAIFGPGAAARAKGR
jgi:hypothetical protein